VQELPLEDPDEWTRLPLPGPRLRAELERAAGALGRVAPEHRVARLNRAIILGLLDEHARALDVADAVLRDDPESVEALWVRAALRDRAGDEAGALADIELGLKLAPRHAPLLELKGAVLVRAGEPERALAVLDQAVACGARASVHRRRAEALMALNRPDAALEDWSAAIGFDEQDGRAYLGRARAAIRSGLWDDYALADLEKAAAWSGEQPGLLLEIAYEYAQFVSERAERLPRVLGLAGRSFDLYLRALSEGSSQ
jgi:tetratricopeptide (TPR) repeat protein